MADRPIIDAIRGKLRDDHPIAGAVVDGLVAAAARGDTDISQADVPAVAEEVTDAITADPVAVNELSLERGTESRTGMSSIGSIVTGSGTLLVSIGTLITQAATLSGSARWIFVLTTLLGGGTLGSGLYGAFGRWRQGLPPMYFRIYNPLSWLARRKSEVLAEPAA